MKRINSLVIVILTTISTLFAQEYKTAFSSNDIDNKVHIMIEDGKIEIIGHASNEVIVEAEGYEPPPKKAEGLKPLYARGVDNSGIGLSIKEEGNTLHIMSVRQHSNTDYTILLPDNSTVQVTTGVRNNDLLVRNMKGEVELKAHSNDMILQGLTGPIVVNGISGDIEVVMNAINTQKPSVISLVSGDIDIAVPAATAANLKLSSVSGEIYTDFDIQMTDTDEEKTGYRGPIVGTINGGGPSLELRTVSGSIFLRKK